MAKNNHPTSGIIAQFDKYVLPWVGDDPSRADAVRRALQDVVARKYSATTLRQPPTAQAQMERARQLWPDITLPEPPENFVPRDEHEILLLHVPGTIEDLWGRVKGEHRKRWIPPGFNPECLRLAPKVPERSSATWLGFSPLANKGRDVSELWGNPSLAGPEVFSAFIQFPGWLECANSQGRRHVYLAGYQVNLYGDGWQSVPSIRVSAPYPGEGVFPELVLSASGVHSTHVYNAVVPEVRELT